MKKIERIMTAFCLTMALVLSGISEDGSYAWAKTSQKLSISKKKVTLLPGEKTSIKVKGIGKKKKVVWSILGKNKNILKKVKSTRTTITVKALKIGKATIKASVGKKKLTCNVTVKEKETEAKKRQENFYKDQDEFGRAVSDMIRSHPVKSSAAIAASDRFFTGRLVVQGKNDSVDFSEYSPSAVLKNAENISIVQFETSDSAKKAFQEIANRTDIEWAEPDLYFGVADGTDRSAGETSSDAGVAGVRHLSWGVDRMGVDAYARQTPKSQLVVAVVDTGVSSHSFLSGRIVSGYDYIDNDYDPSDLNSHGTHVAGTIVDCTPGLNVKIMPVRVLDASGSGNTTSIGIGIRYAADHGASVINLSLGGGHSNYLDSSIQYALNKGVTVVAAAGNEYSNTASFCPSHLNNIIVVAAIDEYENRANFSNYGNSVDVVAPGVDIVSCIPGGSYASYDGTSMATPHISGLAAMIMLNYPGITPDKVEAVLKSCCRDLGTVGWDIYYGYGVPDMSNIDMIVPVNSPVPTLTPLPTPTPTVTKSPVWTPTPTPTATKSPVWTPTPTPTVTKSPVWTPTPTPKVTKSPVWTPTPTPTVTKSPVWTPTPTPTVTKSPVWTPMPIVTPEPEGGTGAEAGYQYRILNNQTALITGYTGKGGNLTIPVSLGGYTVSGIGDSAFQGNVSVQSLRIIGSVWIGENAFEGCSGLKSISIDGMVSGVGASAFANCNALAKIQIAGMFFQVQPDIFSGCSSFQSAYVTGMIDRSVQAAFGRCASLKNIQITGLIAW